VKFYVGNPQTVEELEAYLIFFEPEGHLERLVRYARDIYEHRTVLKQIPSSDFTVGHLARIVREALESGRAFRFVDCVKVIRAIIVAGEPRQFGARVVEDLFEIYRRKTCRLANLYSGA
jgi:hypothetical protein